MFHRINDIETISAQRFLSLVTRLPAYGGALKAVIVTRAHVDPVEQVTVPVVGVDIAPQAADAMLNTEMYGAIPGMGPVFSHSYAPLAKED